MKAFITIFYVLCLFAVHSGAKAETLTMTAPPLPGLIEKDGLSGLLTIVAREILNRAGHQLDLKVMPSMRAGTMVKHDKAEAIMPVLDIEMDFYRDHDMARSLPLIFRRDFAFVRPGSTIPATIRDLEGLRMVMVRGYGIDPRILDNERIIIARTNNDLSSLRMVEKGRADVIVLDAFSVTSLASKHNIRLAHNPDKPMFVYGASIIMKKHHADTWLPRLDPVIKKMWLDGSMERMIPGNLNRDFITHLEERQN